MAAESQPTAPTETSVQKPAGPLKRTRTEVDALIEKEGMTPPGWWDEVTLNVPPDLDLTWANPTQGQNQNKFLMCYIWNVINTNPGKWKEGAKLLAQTLKVNKNDPAKLKLSMNALGKMYHDFFQDYARAAYWWQKAGSTGSGNEPAGLADCYYRLGNKEMAAEVVQKVAGNNAWNFARLWSDIGEYDKALGLIEGQLKQNQPGMSQWVNLLAGDVCRAAGRYKEALGYYEKAATPVEKFNQEYITRKAKASVETLKVFEMLDLSKLADGAYSGEGQGYCSVVKVSVEVKATKIAAVNIVSHHEKQFYGSLVETPRRIIEKQGLKGVDAFTSATMTSDAIITASARALNTAMSGPPKAEPPKGDPKSDAAKGDPKGDPKKK
jgi:uncharacterized protein with FMN-binding domain